jgi:hypothetical protein
MTFYTGSSADGSDAVEWQGMYTNPNNPNEWSSTPYPRQARLFNQKNEVLDYMNGRYTLNDVYNQIKAKSCPLSRSLREYVLSHYDEQGNFLKQETKRV